MPRTAGVNSGHSPTSVLSPYFSRTRGNIIPGAHRLQLLLTQYLHTGILEMRTILVAGTNGKGSVCAMLESALHFTGLKTGLYTSPHLVHPAERIRIQGIPADENTLEKALAELEPSVQKYLPDATFFEISTAAALLVFQRAQIEVLVCEVGLGGLYDSTNALSPCVSVLTSVGLDHTELLGDTLFKIARDKAYVSRRNNPFITGTLSQEAREGAFSTAQITGCEWVDTSASLSLKWKEIGQHAQQTAQTWLQLNLQNLKTVLFALQEFESETGLKFFDNKVAEGLACAFWPGRFDIRVVQNQTILLDGAHNSHGFAYFLNQFQNSKWAQQPVVALFGSLADKDWQQVLPLLEQISQDIVFTMPSSPRAVEPEEFLPLVSANINKTIEKSLPSALKVAFERARTQNALLVLTGSLVLVGECFEHLHLNPFAPLVRNVTPV